MSYKTFNLTTIQLPAPSSNMTKSEYKEAYGIDLDSIDIHKFTLIVFGKEKYAIDQIKAVEGGYEIYFNGRILSITDIVQTSDEVYNVANSKPLYLHPIVLSNGINTRVTMMVFDNSPTPYTLDSLVNKIIQTALDIESDSRFPMGGYLNGEMVAYCGAISTGLSLFIFKNSEAYVEYTPEQFKALFVTITDGVNKIN